MKYPKVVFVNQKLFTKTPFWLVLIVAIFIGLNVYLNLKIKNTDQEISQIVNAATNPTRVVPAEFAQRRVLGQKTCPSEVAGNPQAPLKFKLFESLSCPFCVAQNKVLDELLPMFGDLFYGEWYQVEDCRRESQEYRISGVPTFIFTADGVEKPPAYGFLDKQQLADYICRVSQDC